MCPRWAQPRWQMRDTMVVPPRQTPFRSGLGLPGMSGDPMGSGCSSVPSPLPFPSPSPQNQWQEARGRCSKSQSGSTGSAQGHTHTHSHRGTRKPHHLDEFPSPNLSLLIHKMGRCSRPLLTRLGWHLRSALGREAHQGRHGAKCRCGAAAKGLAAHLEFETDSTSGA